VKLLLNDPHVRTGGDRWGRRGVARTKLLSPRRV